MKTASLALAGVFCLALAAPALAQESPAPTLYTYVAEWGVPRAQWTDMTKFMDAERGVLDKLVDDGTLVAYGTFQNQVHTLEGITHGDWFEATSIAGILKALATLGPSSTSSPVLAASRHQDFLFQSTVYGSRGGSYHQGYLWAAHFTIKPGQLGTWMRTFTNFVRPVLDQLMADGTILHYQLHTDVVHSPGSEETVDYAYVTSGPDGIDKFRAAVAAAEARNSAIAPSLGPIEIPAGHFDMLAQVGVMRLK
ncbi:MAG TPA: hypothetical protein VGS20_08355 [Candidatus Acidoferrales bacterium]|nr:hypothetical protein [Candidatus Acidoferrales bacterium]